MRDKDDERRLKDNLQGEIDGAAVYAALAEAEAEPNLAKIYRRLAAVERAHAEFWQSRLNRTTKLAPSLRARGLAWLARRFGPSFVLPTLAASEARNSSHYDAQPDAVAGGLPTSAAMPASFRSPPRPMPALRAPRWPSSRAAIAAVAMRCVPQCSAPMMASCPI